MNKLVHLAGILFSTIFGFSFMFSKIALNYVSPMGLIAYRFLIAFIVFEVLRQCKVVRIRFDPTFFKMLFLVALFQPILYFIFETFGLRYTQSSEAGMMIALIPIFVSIFSSIILKEKTKKLQIFFILLSVSGVIYIQASKSNMGFDFELLGFVLLLGAVISAALFNIASRSASKNIKPYELTYFMMLFGAVVFNVLYVVQLLFEKRPLDYINNMLHPQIVFPVLYLGIIASIVGFFLVNFALSKLPAHVSSIYANLATIVAIIAGALILDESIATYHIIGSAMIIIGVYGTVSLNKGIKKFRKTTLNS